MECPSCGKTGRVSYSRRSGKFKRRVRVCLGCGKRYETLEVTVVGRLREFLKVWVKKI